MVNVYLLDFHAHFALVPWSMIAQLLYDHCHLQHSVHITSGDDTYLEPFWTQRHQYIVNIIILHPVNLEVCHNPFLPDLYSKHVVHSLILSKQPNKPHSCCVPERLAVSMHAFPFTDNYMHRVYIQMYMVILMNSLWKHQGDMPNKK